MQEENSKNNKPKLIFDKMQKPIDYLKAELDKLYAVELLEYHDKNLLSGDNKSRSEARQEQLLYCRDLAIKINLNSK